MTVLSEIELTSMLFLRDKCCLRHHYYALFESHTIWIKVVEYISTTEEKGQEKENYD